MQRAKYLSPTPVLVAALIFGSILGTGNLFAATNVQHPSRLDSIILIVEYRG
jgi:hypothetical protein